MDLLQKRNNAREAMAEKAYIQKVLREEGKELDKVVNSQMKGFSTDTKKGRTISVNNTKLEYKHRAIHRFVDMKRRKNKKGDSKKKKSYPVHNRPIYGIANNIIKRLHYGYTEEVKNTFIKQLN